MSHPRHAFLLAILVAGAAVLIPRGAVASSSQWSDPVDISGGYPWPWFPSIAIDPYGDVHVVFNGNSPYQTLAGTASTGHFSDQVSWLYYTEWNGQRWSPPNPIEGIVPALDALRSSLIADKLGHLDLFFRGIDLPGSIQKPVEAARFTSVSALEADQATAWSPTVPLDAGHQTYLPVIAIDSHGTLHAIWTEYDGVSSFGLYYRRSTDGGKTWSPRVALEDIRSVFYYRADIKIDKKDNLYVVWDVTDTADPETMVSGGTIPIGFVYAQSTDGGKTWKKTPFIPREATSQRMGRYSESIEGSQHWPVQPAIGIDGRGQILLVWRDQGTDIIYFQRSVDGNTWSEPVPVPGIDHGTYRPFDEYDMAVDSAGHVHLVAVGFPPGDKTMALMHSEWDGERWSPADIISSAPPFPEWPQIAVAEGNRLQVVWFDRDRDFGTPIDVRYSTAVANAPFVAPLPRPVLSSQVVTAEATPPALTPLPNLTAIAVNRARGVPIAAPVPTTNQPNDGDRSMVYGAGAAGILLLIAFALKRLRAIA